MPHAALIVGLSAAVVVGSVVAYEAWRESNGEEPLMEGVRAGWNGFKSDLQRGLWDFRERMDGRDPERRSTNDSSDPLRRSSSPRRLLDGFDKRNDEQAEMDEVQRDLEDFEMHERQMSTSRQLWNEEMNGTLTRRRRHLNGSTTYSEEEQEGGKDRRQLADVVAVDGSAKQASLFDGFQVSRQAQSNARSNTSTVTSDEDWYSRANSPSSRSPRVTTVELSDGNISDSWTHLETGSTVSRSSDDEE